MARDARPAEPTQQFTGLSLQEYMLAAGQSDPIHLKPIVEVLEAVARGEKIRCVIAAPRQHGKSTLILHAIPWLLLTQPTLKLAYATYGQQFSGKQSRIARSIAMRTGVKLSDDHNTIQEWHTDRDGYCLATSIDGPLTGYTVRVGVIDDAFKGRAEAESLERRDLAHDWLKGDMMGCLGPKGSLLVIGSRYHEDDLSGRCIKEGFDEIRLPAICDDEENDLLGRKLGEALCPWGPDPDEPRDLAFLRDKEAEIGDYDFQSLFQGRPRSKSGKIFRDAFFYDELPPIRRTIIGCDFAYSLAGDRIAIVVLGESDLVTPTGDHILYVLDVHIMRKSAVEAHEEIRAAIMPWGNVPAASYVTDAEKGILAALASHEDKDRRVRVEALPARMSKIVRAARTSRRWNAGAIRVKKDAPWSDEFVRSVCGFTGLPGGRDDEADALVSAFDRMTVAEQFKRGSFRAGRRVM